jgi:3-methyladenine DNA glycosylase AlkC
MFSALPLPAKLDALRRFAADPHFGVREIAWTAMRDEVAGAVDEAVALLRPWVLDPNENIRRFASELTRPRGVWCAHIEPLKAEPWRGLPLLEPLKADPSRYVQKSVANWLNDAAKTQPQWVDEVCDRWSRESKAASTQYIARRARRSIG